MSPGQASTSSMFTPSILLYEHHADISVDILKKLNNVVKLLKKIKKQIVRSS